MDEIWKPVLGYEGIYGVSNLGNVKRELCVGHGTSKGKILKPGTDNHGYKLCVLSKDQKKTTYRIHRLVAEAFIGERPNGFEINHIDGNKLNNLPWNLEYISPIENIKHAWRIGLMKGSSGSINGKAKLNESKVLKIREILSSKILTQTELAKIHNVSFGTIHNILNRLTWTHI